MKNLGIKNPIADLRHLGLEDNTVYWNLSAPELVEKTLEIGEGVLADNGALVIKTGEFTGRSPKDRFIVQDEQTKDTVDWNNINFPFSTAKFEALKQKMINFLKGQELYVKDAYACADNNYKLNLRLIAQKPWSAMFAGNMFLRPTTDELLSHSPEWTIICAPEFKADATTDGTRQHNFAIINFSEKTILIGGTGYTGEIKKGIFSVLNYTLPHHQNVLSMHCSSNVGINGDTAVFFGLSGTGKTTLSADPDRSLIGDDEHGWSDTGVFNFEGGCYAKTIDLSAETEPEIFNAIKFGAILENIKFFENTRTPDYSNVELTQNTRVSYPIDHIENSMNPSKGGTPKNIFFLTCDAFGVLPPISKLNRGQAMYHFISGYTAKVAGTEEGINEPTTVFSACFGAPFLPLHPTQYAEMLGERMQENDVNVWLINTGWSGGPYGVGSRMKLKYTRAMISAALNGHLDNVDYETLPLFNLSVPCNCANVPSEILNPRNTWTCKEEYDQKATNLAIDFIENFKKYADKASEEILNAAPALKVTV